MKSLRRALVALFCMLAWATPAAAQQAPLGDGAWSWFGDPRAVHHEGRTYVGWVDREGDIKVMSYNHTTEERVTAVLQARLNQDDHANPSIHVLPSGKLMVFYSAHVGPAMHYRVSEHPKDVTSWGPPQTVPTNVPGIRGYTYPNPVYLADENTTYLFWRGGNYNPTYSTQVGESGAWSAARNLIHVPRQRPYVKYASSGGDTIHVAYTNAHPEEHGDVNIYYARVRVDGVQGPAGDVVEGPDGDPIGTLAAPIEPAAEDAVFAEDDQAWVHDVAADSMGRPVIVFASFPSEDHHRYHYARWTGSTWEVEDIVDDAGGSFSGDPESPYYSGGLTLDHRDPSLVYLSRRQGDEWLVEQWTRSASGTWSSAEMSPPSAEPNVRPVAPRGTPLDFGDDLKVIWMGGPYPGYEEYETTLLSRWDGGDQPPVADAEPSVRSGPAPLPVQFTSHSEDSDGSLTYEWDFDEPGTAHSPVANASNVYDEPGHYFPKLTVTSDGATSIFVDEIVVGERAAPVTRTGGAGGARGATVHGAVDPENQPTRWYFKYGPTAAYGAVTPTSPPAAGDSLRQVSAELPDLVPGRLYHYRLVAFNPSGTTEGEDRVMVAGSQPGSDAYRDAVLGPPGVTAYWRLGELSGGISSNERPGAAGVFGVGSLLGQVGVLGALGDTAASFDGLAADFIAAGPELGGPGPAANATMEGWFRWRSGTTAMRDNTGRSGGWLLAFEGEGTLRYRVGGRGYDTGIAIGKVRDGTWHHLVATKNGPQARLYIDGALAHPGANAGTTPADSPWHVMRNGNRPVFSQGEADEIALYTRALSAAEVKQHYDTARQLAARPLPPETPGSVVDPPAAGTGPGGGVLTPTPPASRPSGVAFVRRGRLIVRGASGTRNRITARRRGRAWQVADAAAPLRAGRGCRRLGARKVSCRAARIKRIEMHGGAGADTLTVRGRIRALLVGGPGADRLTGGRLARFRGGAGADRSFRRP